MIKLRYNLKSKLNAEELIIAVCFLDNIRIKVSTKQKVFTKAWNNEKQRCTITDDFQDRVNRASRKTNKFLDELDTKFNRNIEINHPHTKSGLYSTPEFLKFTINNIIENIYKVEEKVEEKKKITPLVFFDNYINGIPQKINPSTGTFISIRTQAHHRTVLKRFIQFFKNEGFRDEFSVFDKWFAIKFEKWAYNIKNYKSNTIPASFSVLKVWLNAAFEEGLISDTSYKSFKSKASDVENIYLTNDEIKRIYELDIKNLKQKGEIDQKSKIEITRDLFIIGCFTGLRFSDLNHLNKAHFDIEKQTITILTEKTKEFVSIPMHSFIKELYIKYNGVFPCFIDKSHVIDHLKELGRHAKIEDEIILKVNRGGHINSNKCPKYEQIKVHTARRSFATNLYLKGASTYSIMKLTGHTTEANFMKYIKITRKENLENMRKFFE